MFFETFKKRSQLAKITIMVISVSLRWTLDFHRFFFFFKVKRVLFLLIMFLLFQMKYHWDKIVLENKARQAN